MNHKILLAISSKKDRVVLEQALLYVVERGGELLFTEKESEIQEIIKKETPALAFIDSKLIQDPIDHSKTHIIWLIEKGEKRSGKTLEKPLLVNQILEKCSQIFPDWEEAKPYPM